MHNGVDLVTDEVGSAEEIYTTVSFWYDCEPWLLARGFYVNLDLLEAGYGGSYIGWYIPSVTHPAPFPYARCVRTSDPVPVWAYYVPTRVAWGQDTGLRDVVLKVTRRGSEEYRICQRLLASAELFNLETFPGVLPPVAILDTPYDYAFIVMPMWGAIGKLEEFSTVAEILCFMRCTARDIDTNNILVNCYRPDACRSASSALPEHRRSNHVCYSLIDFDIALQMSEDIPLGSCRLPASAAYIGSALYQPPDVRLGEHEYNPYAFDVASLGNIFRIHFSSAVAVVPLLAPLFDKMTTHIISNRFTASESARFIDAIIAQLPAASLDAHVELERSYDRDIHWSFTNTEFRTHWALYKTPTRPWRAWVLNKLVMLPMGWPVIRFIRRMLRV
ncbi:hypothetical protein FKP32DRAFT_1609404 [Trametes sanguinea]|nr:hypothetical protein FKP32DRAFT_1609404 [Trametes sanguinea]